MYCCLSTRLTTLPTLPASLRELYCSRNPLLTTLPELPATLETLHCSRNPLLTTLPELPATLDYLDCHNNPLLATLPIIPPTLQDLYCVNCPLLPIQSSNIDEWREFQGVPDTEPTETRVLSTESQDAIMYCDIVSGDVCVDFDEESKYGRYYLRTSFEMLQNKHPLTRKIIVRSVYYTVA